MKKIVFILTFLFSVVGSYAAENAGSILDCVVKRMSTEGVEARFSIIASGISQDGSMKLSGDRFVIKTQDLSTWYDGKAQWTLSKAINEVNITEPTPEELSEVNPLIILGSLSRRYNAELGTSSPGFYVINLQDKNGSSAISGARVKVDAATYFPAEIELTTSTGEKYRIVIKSIKNVKNYPVSTFRFNTKDYPSVEVIDLR